MQRSEQHQEEQEKVNRKVEGWRKFEVEQNSKRAHQLPKDLATVNTLQAVLFKTARENASQTNDRYWLVEQNTALSCIITRQWSSVSIDLPPVGNIGRPSYPSQRRWGCCTISEEREVSWKWQHPSRTGPSRWRSSSYCSQKSAARFSRQENSKPCGSSPWSSHFPRKATCSSG